MASVIGAIRDKWISLGGAASFLGEPLSDELKTPDGIGRFNRFHGGMIYWTPSTGAHEVHGAILDRWAALGFEQSFLGYPISDEKEFSEGGRISSFQHGDIFWWPDTGPIELKGVIVHYTGLNCFGETDFDGGSDSDEPYVVMGVVSTQGTSQVTSPIYEDVDSGESRPDLLEIYRGKPTGLILSVLLMEHDNGDPKVYGRMVRDAAEDIFEHIGKLDDAGLLLLAVPAALYVSGPLFDLVGRITGAGDDIIGSVTISLTAKRIILLAARTANSVERSVGFKVETPLLSGGGASYKAYFGLVPQ